MVRIIMGIQLQMITPVEQVQDGVASALNNIILQHQLTEATPIHSVVPQVPLVEIKGMKIGCLIRSFIDGAEQLRYPLMNWLLTLTVHLQIRKPSLGIYAPGSHKIVAHHGATAYSAEMIIGMVVITSAAAVGREKGYPFTINIVMESRLMLPAETRGTITCSLTR